MNIYDDKLSEAYSGLRENFMSPDNQTLGEFYKAGIKDKKILDFGCGDGRYAIQFAKDGAAEVVGVDVSSAMIELAQKRSKDEKLNIRFLDIKESIPVGDDYFDAVFSNFVVHYIADTLSVFKEIQRVMKPGGNFVAILNVFQIKDESIGKGASVPIILGTGDQTLSLNILLKTEPEIIGHLKQAGFSDAQYVHVTNQDARINPSWPGKDKIVMDTLLFNAVK